MNAPGTVLIIDDSPEALDLARVRLLPEGLSIITASNGDEGLSMALASPPDLILLDLHMPGRDGFEVLSELRNHALLSHVPVIILSAEEDVKTMARGLDLGAVDFVRKPFNAFELRARVRAALRTKRLQDLLARYGEVDYLTELYNRRVLMERLTQEAGRSRRHGYPVALVMGDIDHFKSVNDRFGHTVGDTVLSSTAACIRGSFRAGDVAARYGGEEFAVLLAYSTVAGAVIAAERCRAAVSALSFSAGQQSFGVTISFGVAAFLETDTPEDLVARADMALYRAKQKGRDMVVPI